MRRYGNGEGKENIDGFELQSAFSRAFAFSYSSCDCNMIGVCNKRLRVCEFAGQ